GRAVGADEEIDVLDGLAAAAEAAAQLDAGDARGVAQGGDDGLADGQGLVQADAPGDLAEELDAFEDLLLRLLAEAPELGHAPVLAGGAEGVEVADLELVINGLDLLGAEALDAHHLQQAGGHLGAQLVEVGERAGGDEGGDLLAEGLADALDVGEAAGAD